MQTRYVVPRENNNTCLITTALSESSGIFIAIISQMKSFDFYIFDFYTLQVTL